MLREELPGGHRRAAAIPAGELRQRAEDDAPHAGEAHRTQCHPARHLPEMVRNARGLHLAGHFLTDELDSFIDTYEF